MKPVAPSPALSGARVALAAPVPFVLGAGAALACHAASSSSLGLFFGPTAVNKGPSVADASLGLFFGPVLLVSLIAPALALGEEAILARLVAAAGVTFGVWLVWLVAGGIGFVDALRCGLVLASWVFALAGFAALIRATGLHAVFASALTAALALAWLTWPVWLSHWLTGQSAPSWLTAPHPLLSLNGVVLARFNAWDRYEMAYRDLTTLNQDILYTMPASVWPMVVVHVALGAAGFAVALLPRSKAAWKEESP